MIQLIDDQMLVRFCGAAIRLGPRRRSIQPAIGTFAVPGRVGRIRARRRTIAFVSTSFPRSSADLAIQRLLELPEEIGMGELEDVGTADGELRRRHALNVLGTEALAAALHLDAGVFLSAPSPRLEQALRVEGIYVEIIEI